MRRRDFITVLAGAIAWIFAARAQEHRRVARTSTSRCRSDRGGLEACAGWLVADRCSQAARVRTLDGISRDQPHSAAPVSNVPHSSPNLQPEAGILPIKMIRTHRRNGLFRCLISGGAVTIKRRQATVQNASVSDEPMSIPRTSRRPSLLTPTTRSSGPNDAPASRGKPRLRHGLQVAAAKLGSGTGARDERRLYIIPELDL